VIDVTRLDGTTSGGASPAVTVAELTGWEDAYGEIHAGDVVLLHTGWDQRYRSGPEGAGYGADALVRGTGPGWPAPTPEAVGWLHERGVQCAGTDGLSIGPAEGGAPTHLAGLSRDMVFVEALAGLDHLPPRGAWFLFLPLNLVDGTGAPGRALAVLP
jgi:isatin hydrolase